MHNPSTTYHKIQSLFKRDPATKNKQFLLGQYSLPVFEYLQDLPWVGAEKIDGTNIRLYKSGRIAGRTNNAQIHSALLEILGEYSSILKQSDLPEDTVLYGEGYGRKIQSGGHYLPDTNDFVLFDVMISGHYQPRESVEDIATQLGLKVAPIVAIKSLPAWVEAISNGEYMESLLHPGAKNEGVILRPQVELCNRNKHRVITKLKFKDFGLVHS